MRNTNAKKEHLPNRHPRAYTAVPPALGFWKRPFGHKTENDLAYLQRMKLAIRYGQPGETVTDDPVSDWLGFWHRRHCPFKDPIKG